jgi:hypothetical protein
MIRIGRGYSFQRAHDENSATPPGLYRHPYSLDMHRGSNTKAAEAQLNS